MIIRPNARIWPIFCAFHSPRIVLEVMHGAAVSNPRTILSRPPVIDANPSAASVTTADPFFFYLFDQKSDYMAFWDPLRQQGRIGQPLPISGTKIPMLIEIAIAERLCRSSTRIGVRQPLRPGKSVHSLDDLSQGRP